MLSNKLRMKTRNQGQGLVEFALVLPVLLVVVFGVFDLGRAYFTTIILTGAAREGARYLSVYPDDVPEFNNTRVVARNEARNSGINIDDDPVDIICANSDSDPDKCDSGGAAVVTVSHGFELVLGWLLSSPITITRSAQMVVP